MSSSSVSMYGNGSEASTAVMSSGGVSPFSGTTINKLERDGSNYHFWVLKISLILQAQDLFDVVNGDELRPVNGDDSKWVAKDKRARVAICLTIHDTILYSLGTKFPTSRSVWLKLESVYQPKSLMNKLVLRRQLMSLRMNEGDNVAGHVNQVKQIADQLCIEL